MCLLVKYIVKHVVVFVLFWFFSLSKCCCCHHTSSVSIYVSCVNWMIEISTLKLKITTFARMRCQIGSSVTKKNNHLKRAIIILTNSIEGASNAKLALFDISTLCLLHRYETIQYDLMRSDAIHFDRSFFCIHSHTCEASDYAVCLISTPLTNSNTLTHMNSKKNARTHSMPNKWKTTHKALQYTTIH